MRSVFFLLCVAFAASSCAVPITDIVVSPAQTRSSVEQHARSRVERHALQVCADVARRHGLQGSVGHYARRISSVSYADPTIDIIDLSPPDLISIRVRRSGFSAAGERVARDLSQALTQQFGADSVRVRDHTWLDF
jgi:hypothetical protein